MKEKISVVIPCYKSEKTICDVVERTIRELLKRNNNFEIILVNDGSTDNTWNEIVKLNKKYSKIVKGINFTKNFGQHAATLAGLRFSSGTIVATIDDDGQTPPEFLWKLIDKLNEGFDVVIAKYPELKESIFRRIGSYLNKLISELLIDKPKEIRGASYRVIRRYVVIEMLRYDKAYPYISGLIYRVTQNIGQVEIEHQKRKTGKSGYTIKKLVGLIMNGFTSFSVKPLRISSLLGMITSIIGFLCGILVIIKKIINPNIIIGYSSIMASFLFASGLIMLILGLIGEYVGRMYISINNSPQYVIKERINIR